MSPDSLLPPDEAARLRSLHQQQILHILRESVFDELVRLATLIFHLPISLIALVDAEQVEYLANEGLPGQVQQPRGEALCSYVVRDNKAVVFADVTGANQHQLTSEAIAAAHARNLQFYAGVPLRTPDHRSIGTLCVLDHQPRTFSEVEQQVLEQLAQVVTQTILTRHYCLVEGLGAGHWHEVQALLVEEIEGIKAQVRYMITRRSTEPTGASELLQAVLRRLAELHRSLAEYWLSKQ